MRSVFIGSSAYGLPALELLCKNGMQPQLVVSQPDKPAGRNLTTLPTPITAYAIRHEIPFFTPDSINSESSISYIAATTPDILITASYGGIIGKELRFLAPRKAINLHPSLLPKYRGASPIQSALLKGESTTGTTIYRLIAELDAGPIIAQQSLEILPNENYSSLHDRLAAQAATMLLNFLQKDTTAIPPETPQEHCQASWCPKIDTSLCMISWNNPAEAVLQKINAFSYHPGAWCYFRTGKLKLLKAQLTDLPSEGLCGTIAKIIKNTGFTVNCLDQQLLISEVQAEGKKLMDAAAFANGARLCTGEKLWM
ncbi:MAG: methionyl-tRNA formyltransferase [Candidatus Cloacimonetes bacterium HGW-Cloacimonetes-3]|nr:MAG: methionyl-tRNA formyltransferase [Candidatus Cloacimonetes bacterium HGW-Cloacimonetes-3]